MTWRRFALLLLATTSIAFLVTACGDEKEKPPGTPSGTAPAATTVTPGDGGTSFPPITATPTTPAESTETAATSTPMEPPGTGTASGGLIVGLDMDPFATPGNSCPGTGNEDCTLGTIEGCISVPNVADQTFTIDAFIQGLPRGFQAWSYNLEFPDSTTPARLTMIDQITTSPTLNLIVQSPDSQPIEVSEDVPDPGTPHNAGVGEFGSSENTPPFTQGVLGRYEFVVGEGAASGLYDLKLDPIILVTVLDSNGVQYTGGVLRNGVVALGKECP